MASHFPFPWRVSSPSLSLSLSLAHPSSTILPSLCFTLTYACACFPPRSNSSCSVRPLLSSPLLSTTCPSPTTTTASVAGVAKEGRTDGGQTWVGQGRRECTERRARGGESARNTERESGRRRRLQRRERVPCNDAATRCAVQPY